MKGGSRQTADGFTIVETLIVLAVTGSLFVSAIIMLSGRQRQAEFNTAIRDVQSQLQQSISEVGNGFYPSRNDFNCKSTISGPLLSKAAGTNVQGTNEGCTFVGKVVQFGYAPDAQDQKLAVFSVVGLRLVTDGINAGQEVQYLPDAKPRVIAPDIDMTIPQRNDTPDATAIKQLRAGLTVAWVRINGVKSGATDVGAIGFLSSLAPISNGNSVISGNQHVGAYAIPGTSHQVTDLLVTAKDINAGLPNGTDISTHGDNIQVCINSGTTDQSGLFTIGGASKELSVDLQIQGAKCAA